MYFPLLSKEKVPIFFHKVNASICTVLYMLSYFLALCVINYAPPVYFLTIYSHWIINFSIKHIYIFSISEKTNRARHLGDIPPNNSRIVIHLKHPQNIPRNGPTSLNKFKDGNHINYLFRPQWNEVRN